MENFTANTSCCTESTFEELPTALKLVFRFDGFTVLLLNGLLLSCLLICRKRFREHIFWTQMISLCIFDIFAGISMIVVSFVDAWPFRTSRLACRIAILSASSSQVTSLLNIFAIGVHRLWILSRIRRQGQGRLVTNKPFTVQLTLITLLGALFVFVAVNSWSVEGQNDAISGCDFTVAYAEHKSQAGLFVMFSTFIPLFLTHILYAVLLIKLKKSLTTVAITRNTNTSSGTTSNLQQGSDSQPQRICVSEKTKVSREKRVFLFIAVILIILDIFTLPTIALRINTLIVNFDSELLRIVQLSIASSITLNSLINPIVYVTRLSEFRNILRDCFLKIRNCLW